MNNKDTFVLHWFFTVVRRWLWVILICTALAGIIGSFVAMQIPPTYQSSVTLLIDPPKDTLTNEYSAIIAAERLASTYSEMLKSKTILDQVISDLHLETTAGKLAKKITAKPVLDTHLVRLTVEDESPDRSAAIANHLAESFVNYIQTDQTERSTADLLEVQTKIQSLDDQISATQSQIDDLQAQVTKATNELDQSESSLAETRDDIRTQQEYLYDVDLAIAQVKSSIKVFQSASTPVKRTSPPYQATVLLFVRQEIATGETGYSSILASERLTQTYAQIMKSRSVLQEVISQLQLTQNVETIQGKITVNPVTGTQLIQLNVTDNDPDRVTAIANTLAEVFVKQTQESLLEPYQNRYETIQEKLAKLEATQKTVQAQIDESLASNVQAEIAIGRLESLQTTYRNSRLVLQTEYDRLQQNSSSSSESLSITEAASVPETPVTNSLPYIGLAIIMGAVIGIGTAVLLELEDNTVHTADDIAKELNVDILGKIGQFTSRDNRPIVINDSLSSLSESFLILANNIRLATLDQPIKTLMVTSPSPSDGKTIVTANLAVTLARMEQKVVAVDADMRIPELQKMFDLDQGVGLTDALLDGGLDGKLFDVNVPGLQILPCGKVPYSPTELIGSARMRNILTLLKEQANFVLIDCPPVLPVADASMLAPMADYAILVLRANRSHRREAKEALKVLQRTGTKVIGVVLNAVPVRNEVYYNANYRKKAKRKLNLGWLLHKDKSGASIGTPRQ